MIGLYRRALEIYQQSTRLRLVRPEEIEGEQPAQAEDSEGISAEEKDKLAAQIEEFIGRSRIAVTPETLAYAAKRRGALLPLFTNLTIFAVVVLALFLASRLLNRQEQSIASGTGAILSAESKLIAALKEESQALLRQKDRDILDIQQRLQAISSEREQLRGQTETLIKAKEQELKGEFESRLAAERDRLQQEGLSSSAVQQRLDQFEAARRREFENQLAEARRQAEAELASKEQAISSLASQYEKDLETVRQDRLQLQGELKRKEADLQRQFLQKEQELESDRARVSDELNRLRRQQEEERLVLDQVLSGYDRVNRSLQNGDYDQALNALDSLKKYFDEAAVAALPAIQKRRGVELFLIGSLEELIRKRQTQAATDASALIEASNLLASVSSLVERGDTLYRAGDLPAAREAYLAALGKVPAINQGYGTLEELRKKDEEQKARELAAGLRQGNIFYQAGNFQSSLERYRQALNLLLKDEGLSRQLTENIMNAGFRILAAQELAQLGRLRTAEQKREELRTRVQQLKDQYQAYIRLVPSSSVSELPSPEALSTLLQAKFLVRRILDSEPVRSQYPELADTMERYFTALAEQRLADGRRRALEQLNALFERLVGQQKADLEELNGYAVPGETDPLLSLLDRLQALLQ